MTSDVKEMPEDLKTRTRRFALRIIRMYSALPKTTVAQIIGKQFLRSGMSVGAQYRESIRARSDAEFISKIEGALQELEEKRYWMELLIEACIFNERKMKDIMSEADELTAIFVSSVKTAKKRRGDAKK